MEDEKLGNGRVTTYRGEEMEGFTALGEQVGARVPPNATAEVGGYLGPPRGAGIARLGKCVLRAGVGKRSETENGLHAAPKCRQVA